MMFLHRSKPEFYALIFLLVTMCFAGCRDLLYDEDYVKMAATTNKLTKVADIGPFNWPNEDLKRGEIRFYPDQGDYSRGFLVIIRDKELIFNYLLPTSVICFNSFNINLNGENSPFFIMPIADKPGSIRVIYDYDTVKMSSLVYANGVITGGVTYDDLDVAASITAAFTATGFPGGLDFVNLFPSPVDDNYYFCGSNGNNLYEMNGYEDLNVLNTFNGFGVTRSIVPANLTHPGAKWQPYVYNVANGKSYLSQPGSKGFEVYSWDQSSLSSPTLLSSVTRPIDYALSTKHILSRDYDSLYVYDEKGANEFKIPMGELYFAYENVGQNSGTEMVFSHVGVIFDQHDNKRDELFVKVYTLPSRDIEKLKQ